MNLKMLLGLFTTLLNVFLFQCVKKEPIGYPSAFQEVEESVWKNWDKNPKMNRIFFPQYEEKNSVMGAENYDIPVAPGISIGARMHHFNPDRPSILFFHGNGEVLHDYDFVAGYYSRMGVNFFIVDYRGYGWSGGGLSLRSLNQDALKAAEFFLKIIGPKAAGKNAPIIMGRSLGGSPASLIALKYQDRFSGLILESAFADPVSLLYKLNIESDDSEKENLRRGLSPNIRLKNLDMPVLIIHGSEDSLIEPEHAENNYSSVGHSNKTLKIIEGAEHNSVMTLRPGEYFGTVQEFVRITRNSAN